MSDVFDLEPHTRIPRDDSYILSYPHILSYFSTRSKFDEADIVRGAHMVYGWMPTVLDLYPESPNPDLAAGAELITKAKKDGSLSESELGALAALVNNSLVGASKLLHFVAPDHFAIWDSKIYAFVLGRKPYNYRVNEIGNYGTYLKSLETIKQDPRFPGFHDSVNAKVGYRVSALRAIELVMFRNAPVFGG